MPYITKEQRDNMNNGNPPMNPGELNYVLTMTLIRYCKTMGECYTTYNDAMGALEGCRAEFYRRKVSPYEDIKMEKNGDVYK